nr:retrotransposon protein, putative, Ty1-copia subclass [Tanacetum cinerariifolium]
MELQSLLQTANQGIKKIDVPSTSVAHVFTVGHNTKKRKTSHSNWKRKAAKGKSDHGSKSKGLKETRRLKHGELNLVMGNRKIMPVTRIGKYELMLKSEAYQNMGCKVYVRREAQDKVDARSEKCFFVGYLEETFGYLFYKAKDNMVFVARRGVFLKGEMISKEDSGSKIDLEEIQESVDEEPIMNTDTQPEVVTPIKPDDISLPILRTSGRVSKPPQVYYGFHIKEYKISDSTLSELDEPGKYKETMASLKATK